MSLVLTYIELLKNTIEKDKFKGSLDQIFKDQNDET